MLVFTIYDLAGSMPAGVRADWQDCRRFGDLGDHGVIARITLKGTSSDRAQPSIL
jgi:hypothetical protein